jgi:predicted 3-demethylubiquinone-9 3-methyltransferase (glyoxalase superfamily)
MTVHPFTVCLWFDTQAQEAAELYVSLFPNSRITGTTPYPAGAPGPEGSTMLVDFELNGMKVQGLNGGPIFTFTEAISLVITVDTQEEIDRYWDALTADGGEPGQCGWLKDRFGLSWQLVPTGLEELANDPDPSRYERAMQAVLQMTKLDLAAIQAAADGH